MKTVPPISQATSRDLWRAYQEVFDTPAGELVLEDLSRVHFMYASTLGNGPVDPNLMLMREGGRNVLLRIHAILNSEEKDYVHQ